MESVSDNEFFTPLPLLSLSHTLDATITRDVRQYLGFRFTKNSVDSELQHQIRENLHMRVVPCKTHTHTHTHTHTGAVSMGVCEHVFRDKESGVEDPVRPMLPNNSQS